MKLATAGWSLGGALAAFLLVSLGWAMTHPVGIVPRGIVGQVVPATTILTLDGKQLALSDLRGTPLVVNFWASWCVPCRQEAPVLNAAATKYAGRVQFVGVDIQDSDSAARAFQAEFNSPYPVGPAISGSYLKWGVAAPPETFFIDRGGMVISKFIGPLSTQVLEVYLSQLGP